MASLFVAGVILVAWVHEVEGHGMLISPPSRNSMDSALSVFSGGKWPAGTDGCVCANQDGQCPGYNGTWRDSGGGQVAICAELWHNNTLGMPGLPVVQSRVHHWLP